MRYRNKVQDDPVPFRSVRRLLGSISPIHGRQSGLFPLHKSEVDKGGRVSRVSILARSVANDPEGGYSFSTVFSGGVLAEHGDTTLPTDLPPFFAHGIIRHFLHSGLRLRTAEPVKRSRPQPPSSL